MIVKAMIEIENRKSRKTNRIHYGIRATNRSNKHVHANLQTTDDQFCVPQVELEKIRFGFAKA